MDDHAHGLNGHDNIVFIPAEQSRRELASARSWLRRCGRVITTPSTIALDAAQCGLPVALAFPGGPVLHGLPVLEGAPDWIDFALSPLPDPVPDLVHRSVRPGNAIERIIACLAQGAGT